MEQQEWSKHENDDDRELVDRGPLSDKEPTPFTPEMRWRFFDHQTWKYKIFWFHKIAIKLLRQ